MVKEDVRKEDFCELDSTEADGIYRTDRSYHLKIRKGPPVIIPVTSLARLTRETAWMLFTANRVTPCEIEHEARYEALRGFPYVSREGVYEEISAGMKLALMPDEAFFYLKRGEVRPDFDLPLFGKRRA